jgi:hypothetical protein
VDAIPTWDLTRQAADPHLVHFSDSPTTRSSGSVNPGPLKIYFQTKPHFGGRALSSRRVRPPSHLIHTTSPKWRIHFNGAFTRDVIKKPPRSQPDRPRDVRLAISHQAE